MIRLISDNNLNTKNNQNLDIIDECISINKSLIDYTISVENLSEYFNGYDIFGDGLMYVTYE